jgi:hypothetical protein
MDRDARVRAARRRQALDALDFERQREQMLVEQLEDVLAEADGAALDTAVFARMGDEDASRVRAAFGNVEPSLDPDDELDDVGGGDLEDETGDDVLEEAARLQDEIESSRRTQTALAQYLDLLAEPTPSGGDG